MSNILVINASARREGSITRMLVEEIASNFDAPRVDRDLAENLPMIDETWIGANFTPADARTDAQKEALALSDALIEEVKAADTIIIGMPVYNFSVPTQFKAWIDMIARAGVTFRYSENGPEGLLTGKKVIVAIASGGVTLGSDYDFATNYTRHVLGFVGITDVTFIDGMGTAIDADGALARARAGIEALTAAKAA